MFSKNVLMIILILLSVAKACETNCKYDITVTLDQKNSRVKTTTKLTYHNRGSSVLDKLIFHFTPNQLDETISSQPYKSDTAGSSFSVIDTSQRSLQVAPFINTDKEILEDYFIIKLIKPLKPSDSVELEMKSESRILDRYGIKHIKGCWHPKIVHQVDEDWQIGIENFAKYRVTIGTLAQSLIPLSGTVTQRKQDENGFWIITCEAENIPDFSIVLSHSDYMVSETADDVTINVFYLRDRNVAERMLNIAKDVVRFYRNMYGFYPDKVLNIIAFDGRGFGGGPIGSNTVHVNKTFRNSEDSTIWAIAHEIGHEYWGWNWVVDTNRKVRWIGLGMGLWTDLQYMEAQNRVGQNFSILQDYLNAVKQGVNTKLIHPTAKDLQNRMGENDLAHSKGYAIALMLEYFRGEDVFREIAKTTLERFAHQAIGTKDFQAVCEEVTGQKMDWFFHQWVYTNNTLDYAIADIKTTKVNSKQQIVVSVEAKGPALMPVDVLLRFTDGSIVTERIPRKKQQCIFISDKTWAGVLIDPKGLLPDTDRSDNIRINVGLVEK